MVHRKAALAERLLEIHHRFNSSKDSTLPQNCAQKDSGVQAMPTQLIIYTNH